MPLGFTRLNERTQRPNPLINFIKPLPGPHSSSATAYLSRVAAISYPIMKKHHLTVMALEEFPPNRAFWGRNFNAGEVIQLVLRDRAGAWLPLPHVQMVMMHELAHCVHMHHAKSFWAVRDTYAAHLRALWAARYVGEGLWGAGRAVAMGAWEAPRRAEQVGEDLVPDALCGGVYRRRRAKRKPARADEEAPEVKRARRQEQRAKRILKKFGAGGVALGEDVGERARLEADAKTKAPNKSRVAKSNRARELRAAAALARTQKIKKEDGSEDEVKEGQQYISETESEYEWSETKVKMEEDDRSLLDASGTHLERVCYNGDGDDEDIQKEKKELLITDFYDMYPNISRADGENVSSSSAEIKSAEIKSAPSTSGTLKEPSSNTCKTCSCENNEDAILCIICSNVLKPEIMRNHWKCKSDACKDGHYINAGDYGRCQVCGEKRR